MIIWVAFRTGRRALMARDKLEGFGYRMIRVYEGSFDDWVENGGDIELMEDKSD